MDYMNKLGAVILAGGKGTRMPLEDRNKVTVELQNRPMVLHIVQFLRHLGIQKVVVVVGHAKESVMHVLKDEHVIFAEQAEQLGTGHALRTAMDSIPMGIEQVYVAYGDDAVIYRESVIPTMLDLFKTHEESGAAVTFLTVQQDDPTALGRVVRDEADKAIAIVEEKDATEEQKKITEINPGCFVFQMDFLKKYLPMLEKNPLKGEYYLTDLIELAFHHGEKVEAVRGGRIPWRAVNTPDQLQEAEKFLHDIE
jgi:UDP-N-acetylglucosamine diphosphorylase/glucosamine-1-phosphate N-acetyltransferase